MKKSVLLLMFAFLAVFGAKAQNYDWNFSDDAVWDPAFGGYPAGTTTTVDDLSFSPGSSAANFGATNANSKTVDGTDYTVRMQFNGAGYSGASDADEVPATNMPTQRYLSFTVLGDVTIDVVGITGSGSSSRKMFLTNEYDLIGTFDFPSGTDASKETVSYTGDATTLYLFCNAAINVYRITVTGGEGGGNGISTVNAEKQIRSVAYFDTLGRKVADTNQKNVVLIKKTTYTDGSTSCDKVITKAY